jgi:hypothetical protein
MDLPSPVEHAASKHLLKMQGLMCVGQGHINRTSVATRIVHPDAQTIHLYQDECNQIEVNQCHQA